MNGNIAKKKGAGIHIWAISHIAFPYNYSFMFEECYTFSIFVDDVELNKIYVLLSSYKPWQVYQFK